MSLQISLNRVYDEQQDENQVFFIVSDLPPEISEEDVPALVDAFLLTGYLVTITWLDPKTLRIDGSLGHSPNMVVHTAVFHTVDSLSYQR